MKKDIHPSYKKAKITCGCGNVLETQNTTGDLTVEICSACHPFFTGKQKLVDTAGRVDKFKERQEKAEKLKDSKKPKKPIKKADTKNLDEKMEEIKEELKEEAVDISPKSNPAKTMTSEDEKDENKDNK